MVIQQVNFSMTFQFLELLRKYVSIYVLLSRIEERKAVAALFATAHEIVKGAGFVFRHACTCAPFITPCREPHFPRLAQTLVDYESPMKKFAEDFQPYSVVCSFDTNAAISFDEARCMKDDCLHDEQHPPALHAQVSLGGKLAQD